MNIKYKMCISIRSC